MPAADYLTGASVSLEVRDQIMSRLRRDPDDLSGECGNPAGLDNRYNIQNINIVKGAARA